MPFISAELILAGMEPIPDVYRPHLSPCFDLLRYHRYTFSPSLYL